MIGVESKRFEPFRGKSEPELSEAYWRPVWGFESVRDGLRDGSLAFTHLDAAQLVKHAFGLRTAVHRGDERQGKQSVLCYLYAEPQQWSDGRAIPESAHEAHRAEVSRFAELVAGDEVKFYACSYRDLLSSWEKDGNPDVRRHAQAVEERFTPCPDADRGWVRT